MVTILIDRSQFTPDGSNPPWPVVLTPTATVPTQQMAELLADLCATSEYVLEIGTGSAFQTAVLAERCKGVVSIECDPIHGVEEKLPANVVLVHADGMFHDTGDQYDAVLVTFASEGIADSWLRQCKSGGRIIVPMIVAGSVLSPICVFQKIGGCGLTLLGTAAYAPFTAMQRGSIV